MRGLNAVPADPQRSAAELIASAQAKGQKGYNMSKLREEEIKRIAESFIENFGKGITYEELFNFVYMYGTPLSSDETPSEFTRKVYQEIEKIRNGDQV